MSTETIEAMALAIDKRMAELDLSPSDLVRDTGFSWTTIGKVRRGERINYSRKLKSKLCRALEWTPNSIDLMFQGDPPIPMHYQSQPERIADLASLPSFETLPDDVQAAAAREVMKDPSTLRLAANIGMLTLKQRELVESMIDELLEE